MARAIVFFSQLEPDRNLVQKPSDWCCGREAEGGGLLNRYTVEKPYRGFESLRHRH
jgi:hypothetical protein